MQVYTHGLMGTTVAAMLAATSSETTLSGTAINWLSLMLVWGFGSILPDLVMAYSFFADKVAGRTPLEHQPQWLIVAKEVSHNFLVWCPIAIFRWYLHQPLVLFFGLGGLLHVVVDVLTHGNKNSPFNFADCQYLWPVYDLKKLNLGVWEYRIETGSLRPKPFEFTVCIVALGATIFFTVEVFLPFI